MKDIEEASDRALKGIESILPPVVENFIAVWIAAHRFDLILQAWSAMNRTRKKAYAKAYLVSAVEVENGADHL